MRFWNFASKALLIYAASACGAAPSSREPVRRTPVAADEVVGKAPEVEEQSAKGPVADEDAGDDDAAAIDEPAEVTKRVRCSTPAGFALAPSNIEDVIKLINALPKPVDIPCLIDALPHPLSINATDSQLSVQPAVGATSPRIFIFTSSLIITFALQGDGAKTVEFSYLLSSTRSIKGELAFPVQKDLALDAAYTEILAPNRIGTRCAACHAEETMAGAPFADDAFSSKALRPFTRQDVDQGMLESLHRDCNGQRNERCDMLDALFGESGIKMRDFPTAMPTLF